MKKVMFAAAVAAGLVAFGDGITSANTVGYQDITIPGSSSGSSYSLFCVTFKNVGGGSFKINSIQVCKADGTVVDDTSANRSRDKITLMKLNPTTAVVYDEQYSYTTRGGLGWHVAGSTEALSDSIALQDGEGVYVANSQNADMKLRVSGEVNVTPVSFAIPYAASGSGYTLCGNFTPNPIKINSIIPLNASREQFNDSVSANRSRDKITLMKLNPTTAVVYDEQYAYTTRGGLGWHIAGSTESLSDSYVLQPGEGVYVANSQGATVYLQLPSPVVTP